MSDVYWYIFLVFLSSAGLQLLYLVFFNLRFLFYKSIESNPTLPPVSIIVAARNESENLYELIPILIEQDYPSFEIIVVNNQSFDDSRWLLMAFQRQYPKLKIVELEKSKHLRSGKKLPLTLAIRAAQYDHFVFTDADCRPTSNQWLRSMANAFSSGKEMVMGYGPYYKQKGFLNALIRFDTTWIAVTYFSFALRGVPYMGVGRNLAYSRKAFDSVGGFRSHYYIVSGDDDLFIQQAAKKRNYTIQLESNSHCYSSPPVEWKRWMYQKRRHYSTSSHYNVFKKALLGIYPMSLFFLLLSFLSLLLTKRFLVLACAVFFGLLLLKWLILGRCFRKLNEKNLGWYFPLWDFMYALLLPFFFLSTKRKQNHKW